MEIRPIARIYTDLPEKFGVPRQSGLITELKGRIVFEPQYRDPEAVKGLSGFDYIWLLWDFSLAHRDKWAATVCPPRLGGNARMGVFATRSPYRPNSIGLSAVRLDGMEFTGKGPVIRVSGIDMVDKTPIYDIKPYIPEYDSYPSASAGFTGASDFPHYEVADEFSLLDKYLFDEDDKNAVKKILAGDPRPGYSRNSAETGRVYGFYYKNFNIRFIVRGNTVVITQIEDTYGAG